MPAPKARRAETDFRRRALSAGTVFARFLRNPHYVPALKPQTGLDPEVGAYIAGDPVFPGFFRDLGALVDSLLPRFEREGKSYLTIAVGCTGGRHRSVYLVERLAAWLGEQGRAVSVRHRDLTAASSKDIQ